MIDLKTLERPSAPNHYLIAPSGFAAAAPDETAPEFALGAAHLFAIVRATVAAQPRTRIVEESEARLALAATSRTPLLRFTDDVTIEVVALAPGRSTLALYSRSRIGYSDLGTNRRRARTWLAAISRRAAEAQQAS